MRFQELRGTRMVALLLQMGIKSAKDMSLEEASRQYGRLRRATENTRDPLGPVQLAAYSQKRRRARITHPGKR